MIYVVTVCYQNLEGLVKTAKSLMGQVAVNVDADIRWIVIDGDSNDGTKEYLAHLPREIRNQTIWISEKDAGIYDAMNKGIECSLNPQKNLNDQSKYQADYILFLNAGDVLSGAFVIQEIFEQIDKQNLSGKVCPAFIYGDALEEIKGIQKKQHGNSKSSMFLKQARHPEKISNGMITHHQAMFYHLGYLRQWGMRYDLRYEIAADYDLTARFLLKCWAENLPSLYIPSPICIFEAGGLSQTRRSAGRREQAIIRRHLFKLPLYRRFMIASRQVAANFLRQYSPRLFAFLRVTLHQR